MGENKNAGSIVKGLIGAFLGSLIGVVLWVVIYQMGYISSIAGIVMVVCAIKGYSLFGGKSSVVGTVLVVLICVGMIYLAQSISFAIEIYNEFGSIYEMSYFDAYKSIPVFLEEPEISSAFFKDLVIGYVFMAIGSFSTVINVIKGISAEKNNDNMENNQERDNETQTDNAEYAAVDYDKMNL
ncbi:MAG: hypothetical protein RR620_07745 [Clostridium sp.]